MPIIYLSPSTQENNFYVNGGTEEEWMNRLADELEPYLTATFFTSFSDFVIFQVVKWIFLTISCS